LLEKIVDVVYVYAPSDEASGTLTAVEPSPENWFQ